MSTILLELPAAPVWQAALAASPAAALALGASLSRSTDIAATWRAGGAASTISLVLASASLAALGVAGSGQSFGVRVDLVGAMVSVLVAFIGWVILRYSRPYLAGEHGETGYVRRVLWTLSAVLLVVSSNHLLVLALAWSAASLLLHRLLTFYPDRQAALTAAHKKFVLGRVADVAMLGACALLALDFGTLRIDSLLARADAVQALPTGTQVAVVLIAVAALIKCAQLPFHGWLIQVMEAPTPVSALLHAGIVNLGGLVLIRLAPLVSEVPAAAGLLVIAGASTAVLAALVMTTRISIKVALAWSTCAQMGFMLMQCGLGLWEMALLHLIAHSLYKAHSFLGAGSIVRRSMVDSLIAARMPPSVLAQVAAAAASLAATALSAQIFGPGLGASPALWVMAAVVAFAFSPLVHAGSAGAVLRGGATAFALAGIYFTIHRVLHGWIAPPDAVPAAPWWIFVAAAFAALFLAQCVVTARPTGTLAVRLYPWCYGGLFLDEHVSRAMFRLWPPPRCKGPSQRSAVPERA